MIDSHGHLALPSEEVAMEVEIETTMVSLFSVFNMETESCKLDTSQLLLF